MQKSRVLLLGSIEGSYRAQYIIEYLSQRNYDLSYVYLGKWAPVESDTFFSRLYSFVLRKIIAVLYLLFLPSATHVFLLPLNVQFEGIYGLAQKISKKTILDFYSSRDYGKNLQLGHSSYSRKMIARHKRYDINIINHSDELLFLNRADAEYYLAELGLLPEEINFKIVPLATPMREKAKLNGFRSTGKTIQLCWWGRAAAVHGIDIILDAANLLKQNSLPFHLLLLDTDSKRVQLLQEKVENYHLADEISVRHDLSFSSGLEAFLVEHCDIALGSFGLTELAKVGLSNKIVDALSMGIPMVTMNTRAIVEFGLDEEELLFFSDPDPSSIYHAVKQLLDSGLNVEQYQKKAIEYHRKKFSKQRFFKDLDSIFFDGT